MTDTELAEIKARADAATPGPWVGELSLSNYLFAHYAIRTAESLPAHPWSPRFIAWMCGMLGEPGSSAYPQLKVCECCHRAYFRGRELHVDVRDDPQIQADVAFLAHAREDVPALIAEIEKLKEDLAYYVSDDYVT